MLPGAQMKLVGADAGHYEHEAIVDEVLLAPSERVVVDVLFPNAGELQLEHRTPERTYRLASIRVAEEEPQEPFADEFEQLRTNRDMTDLRERIQPFLEAPPDKTLAFVAEMDLGGAEGEDVVYMCPMHPEVRSEKADRCPKCGMKLVPEHLAGGHGHDHGARPITVTKATANTKAITATITTSPRTHTTRLRESSGRTTWSRSTG